MISVMDLDPNFRVPEGMPDDMTFYDVFQPPFAIDGIADNGKGVFCRLPVDFLPQTSVGIQHLAYHLAGACVRFTTDAGTLGLMYTLNRTDSLPRFTACAQSGMELFEETDEGTRQIYQVVPAMQDGHGMRKEQHVAIKLPGGLRHYALYLPLYSGLEQLTLGVPRGARIIEGRRPRIDKPVVFYGSSITQGGCASKTGSCYTTILARRLDVRQLNLGFSGNCKGEEVMARYIAGLDMSVFVMDYDHNAVPAEDLLAHHEPFFRIVREAQPELPILILTRPDTDKDLADSARRLEMARATYDHAVAAGDKNVYFLDGGTFFGDTDRDLCTLDQVHPTDIGFLRMADAIEPTLRTILHIEK